MNNKANKPFWLADHLKSIVGGKWLHRGDADREDHYIKGLCVDTRALVPGQIFCALKGLNADGHAYLENAVELGAGLLLVNDEEACTGLDFRDTPVLWVENTFDAMRKLTIAYRRTLSSRVIAITGSVGKTTTKSILHGLLSSRFKGTASPKSFNNHIGVPLTLLNAEPGHHYVICEVGTNHPGEIAALSKMVEPDIAVITAVGRSHLQFFEGVEHIAEEKASLLRYIRPNGIAVVNGDVQLLEPYYKVPPQLVTYGYGEQNNLRLKQVNATTEGVDFIVHPRQEYHLPLLGEHNAMNAMAAIAVGLRFRMTEEQIVEGMKNIKTPAMRLQSTSFGRIHVINDAYNANPESMKAALTLVNQIKGKSRVVLILGDMLELGQSSQELHRDMGEQAAGIDPGFVYFIGEDALHAYHTFVAMKGNDQCAHMPQVSDALNASLQEKIKPHDLILLKASRGVQLEKTIQVLKQIGEAHSP